ncbi:MAG: hypothetical protein WBV55_15330 [Candidatus Sulfotelmatobacter sp.]
MLRHCLPANILLGHVSAASETIAGVPNTLPPQTYNGVLELGRVGFCPVPSGAIKTLLQTYECKTGIYNMLEG